MARIVALLLLFGLVAPPVWADEAPPLQDLLKDAAKSTDPDKWVPLLKQVPEVYKSADTKTRRLLMRRVGDALKSDLVAVAEAGLQVTIDTGDADMSWKEALRRVLPSRQAEQIQPFDMKVFGTLYTLHPDGAIDPLLTLMRKAKSPDIASWAMRALGGYERSRKRVRVLDALASTLLANAPGRRKGGKGSPRWNAMVVFAADTLNRLTGRQANILEWAELWKSFKKTPEQLFARPLPKK